MLKGLKKSANYEKNAQKYVMIPANAKARRVSLESRLMSLADYSEEYRGNRVEWGNREVGFIASGVSYQYVKEVYPDASVLKLGMTNPLPRRLITDFIGQVKKAIVVEELDSFIEDQIKAWGLTIAENRSLSKTTVTGKEPS